MRYNLRPCKEPLIGWNGGVIGGLGWNEGKGPKSLGRGKKCFMHLAQGCYF
jgi:hypothetical protein